jgi:hypothetical protein
VDARIARIAGKQFGVIALEQLLALGLTYAEVELRVKLGRLHRLFRGVYAVGHRRLPDHAWLLAALLSCGSDSFLSHRTAAAASGLRAINVRAIEVTLPRPKAKSRTGLIVHRTRNDPHEADLVVRGSLRMSSVPRLLIELARTERRSELDRLITLAIRKRLLNLDAMEGALHRHAHRPGLKKLKAALNAYRPKPERKSGFERSFDDWLAAHPEIPQPNRNVEFEGIGEIDCYWPEQRFAVETDGDPYHITVGDLERDKFKDTKLQRLGIRLMRITEFRWDHDRRGVLDDVYGFLGITPPPAPRPLPG